VLGAAGRTAATHSRLLYDVLDAVYDWLGFDVVDDAVFRDLVIARIVEPTSKADAARVLTDLGADTVSYRTIQRHLVKVNTAKYRDAIAGKCFTHAADRGGLSLLLYDVTTRTSRLRMKTTCARSGTPRNAASTRRSSSVYWSIAPVPLGDRLFRRQHRRDHHPCAHHYRLRATTRPDRYTMVVAADAGMLSASNLTALDEAGLGFIVGHAA